MDVAVAQAYFHEHPKGRTGILLVNLGTPTAPTYGAVMRYLREFLSDRRVIEIPRALWWPLLYGVILPFRSRASAKQYARVWPPEGSPLWVHSQALADECAALMGDDVEVALGMRYGQPSVADALAALQSRHVRRLWVLPLYPQYAAATTGSVFDAVSAVLRSWRWVPEVHVVESYHDHPAYIQALAEQVRQFWAERGRGERLLMSFHGVPKRCLTLGDPYHCFCQKTARLLAEALGWGMADRGKTWDIVFQSRFGRAEWLQPYFSDALHRMASEGLKQVDVICPGFSVDCLETLLEVEEEYAEAFTTLGGTLRYIPALNATPKHAAVLQAVLRSTGWRHSSPP